MEEDNSFDKHAVAILKDGLIVGHLPKEFSRVSSYFFLQEAQIEAQVICKRTVEKGQKCHVCIPLMQRQN
uniref:HIRAN domain-containing protein n=1 Tax=Amphimedon queenslandica TaxID=400682 RepID=A0A1X7TU04_AMPQE